MAERILAPRNTDTAPAPTTVDQPMPVVRQEGRGRQENAGENAYRGRQESKLLEEMLLLQLRNITMMC